MRLRIALLTACAIQAAPCASQVTPLSRADAIRAALAHDTRLGLARADTAVVAAQLVAARALPNPALTVARTKSSPKSHYFIDLPIDLPWLRQLRIRSAQLNLEASELRLELARAFATLDADTTYTRAIAARERLALSRRGARDADSLLHMAERRRNAGAAGEMDVQLARINAGQLANVVASDSLAFVTALIELQSVVGMLIDGLGVTAIDSLGDPPDAVTPGETVSEAEAGMAVLASAFGVRLQRRSVWSSISIKIGIEAGAVELPNQLLPAIGFGLTLPIFDRNRGAIAVAAADSVRAVARLAQAQADARTQIARAQRARAGALARVTRSRELIASAARLAAMALTAYGEGTSVIATVLEAQRAAHTLLAQYIDDLASAWLATAELRALTFPPAPPP